MAEGVGLRTFSFLFVVAYVITTSVPGMPGKLVIRKDADANGQTFKSFSRLPLVEIIKSEMRLLGPLQFFTSGLIAWFVTMPVTFCRQGLVDITADAILQKLTRGEDDVVGRQRYATRMQLLCPL